MLDFTDFLKKFCMSTLLDQLNLIAGKENVIVLVGLSGDVEIAIRHQ